MKSTVAAAIWCVVGCLFVLITISHIKDYSFLYSHIQVADRPGEGVPPGFVPNPNAGEQIVVVDGPNGRETRQTYFNGQALDQPLQTFAEQFNKHIDDLNINHTHDTRISIILDAVGALTAFFSAIFEWIRRET